MPQNPVETHYSRQDLGEIILAALKQASEVAPTAEVPRGERVEAPSPEELQVLELLKCYIGILADRLRVAPKHISTVSQMVPLLRAKVKDPADLVKAGILSDEAAKLIGKELIEFLEGKRGLAVKDMKIEVIEL